MGKKGGLKYDPYGFQLIEVPKDRRLEQSQGWVVWCQKPGVGQSKLHSRNHGRRCERMVDGAW